MTSTGTSSRRSGPTVTASPRLASRTRLLAAAGDLLEEVDARFPPDGFAWLHDDGGLVTSGVAARFPSERRAGDTGVGAAGDAVHRFLAGIEVDDPVGLPGTGPIAVGALPFGLGASESGAPGSEPPAGAGDLVIPSRVVGRTADGRTWVTTTEAVDARSGDPTGAHLSAPSTVSSNGTTSDHPSRFTVDGGAGRRRWMAAVAEAVALIGRGELDKVVLARQVEVGADRPFDIMQLLRRLRHLDPGCFVYAAPGIVGASPELLVRRRGARVISRPMAGSTSRGTTVADDDRLAGRLESSGKELDEHRMVVDAVRVGLEAVCDQVVASARPEVARLATVAHLATTVVGHLRPPEPSALSVAGLLHPTPAVAGMPRDVALSTLARLEGFDRGLYGGPVGWVDSRGDGDWAVALRCAQIDEAGNRAVLTAGAGIVADSDPGAEWAETQAKLEPMLRVIVQP